MSQKIKIVSNNGVIFDFERDMLNEIQLDLGDRELLMNNNGQIRFRRRF